MHDNDEFCFDSTRLLLRKYRFDSVGDAVCACLGNEAVEWLRHADYCTDCRIEFLGRLAPLIESIVARNDDTALVLVNYQGADNPLGVYVLRTDENLRNNRDEISSECICLSSSRIRQEVEKGGINARH